MADVYKVEQWVAYCDQCGWAYERLVGDPDNQGAPLGSAGTRRVVERIARQHEADFPECLAGSRRIARRLA